eukprot:gene22264-biopygen30947
MKGTDGKMKGPVSEVHRAVAKELNAHLCHTVGIKDRPEYFTERAVKNYFTSKKDLVRALCVQARDNREGVTGMALELKDLSLERKGWMPLKGKEAMSLERKGGHNDDAPHLAIHSLYPELQRVCVLNAPRDLALAGLPYSLRRLEVQFKETFRTDKKALSDLHVSAALSPLTTLAQLEEAILPGFPDASLAALECCTALQSLKTHAGSS